MNTVYSKQAGKMAEFNYTQIFQIVSVPFQKSHAHLQYAHNNCARFEECRPKGVRGVDYTK
jgi:hypothetical protein